MKSPDEIKKGLECCATVKVGGVCPFDCPLRPLCASGDDGAVQREILALIQQLQHNNAQLAIDKAKLAAENAEQADRIRQLEAERDAAVSDINIARPCRICKNNTGAYICSNCDIPGREFEWRGVQKEGSDDGKE